MRYVIIALLATVSCFAQSFVQATNKDSNGSSSTLDTTPSITVTAGNTLVAYTAFDSSSCTVAASGNVANPYQVTDGLSNTWQCIIPNGTGFLVTTKMTQNGTGYFSTPTVSVSGCSSGGTLAATTTGTTPNIVVNGISISVAPSGCGPGLPTISFSGGTPITGNTATAVAVTVATQATQCTALFRAYNITGGSDTISFGHSGTSFSGLSAMEISGVLTTDPLDVEADSTTASSVSSVTVPGTGTYTTSQANEIEVMGQSLVNTGVTWTQASGWTIPAGASVPNTGNHYGITMQYRIDSMIQSGVTSPSATASKSAAFNATLGTFKASGGGGTNSLTPARSSTF